MKKIWLLITLITLSFLSACAAMEDPNPDPDPGNSEYFMFVKDEFDFRFHYTDMYAGINYQHSDFFFVFDSYLKDTLSQTEINSLQTLFLALQETPIRMSILMNQDLESFKTTLEAYDVDPTPELLLTFNLLKELYQTLPDIVQVDKLDFIEYRLDRELTQEEVQSLETLEHYFNILNEQSGDYPIEDGLLSIFLMALELETDLTQEEKDQITIGYNLVLLIE